MAIRELSTGVSLSTLEAGVGGMPLMLVHGFTGAKEDFGDWTEPLADAGWWVVAPDLRGHGGSDKPTDEAAYSLSLFADDIVALAHELGWASYSLLGHSMGGMVAQNLVLRASEPVERLVLMDTHHGPVEGMDRETVEIAVDVLRTHGLAALLELIATLPPREMTPAEQRIRSSREGYQEFADSKVKQCSAAMYAAMGMELVFRHDRLEELRHLAVPTRVLVGAEDFAFLEAAHRMAEAIPDADLVVVQGAAHSPQFEAPQTWWDAVTGFLSAN